MPDTDDKITLLDDMSSTADELYDALSRLDWQRAKSLSDMLEMQIASLEAILKVERLPSLGGSHAK